MTDSAAETNNQGSGQGASDDTAAALGTVVRTKFDEAKSSRLMYEEQWLENLRQYRGVYPPDFKKKMDENRSKAFVRLTRTKVKTADSRLMDMMFPAGGDKNWGINPVSTSPADEQLIAKVAAGVVKDMAAATQAAVAAANQAATAAPVNGPAQGADPAAQNAAPAATADGQPAAQPAAAAPAQAVQPQGPMAAIFARIQATMPWLFPGGGAPDPNAVAAEVDAVAEIVATQKLEQEKDRCHRMEKVIDSQLDVAKYANKCKAVVHSGNLYGTGVLKGPLVEVRSKGSYANAAGSGYQYETQDTTSPYLEAVAIWDIYPDMNGKTPEECEYIIQRHVMMKSDLRKLAKRSSFNAKTINDYIKATPSGDAEILSFESNIREINGKTQSTKNRGTRYEVLEYWGYVDGSDLAQYGVKVPEDQLDQEFEANIWTLGNQVIKAVLNPFDACVRPFHFYYFEKDETSIFGVGIPEIMADTQAVFNAAIRATVDNAAMSAGPMFEVNRDLLVAGEDVDTVIPFRVFERKGDGVAPSVRVMQIPNNTQALLALAEAFKQFGDEATTLPAYTQGEPTKGIAKTVGGLSMLMGAANITIKDTVKNFDEGITEPAIRAMYHWNMQFNPDDTIKGNYEIAALGNSSLVAKELRAQQLEGLANSTLNPEDSTLINRRSLMKKRLLAMDLGDDDLIYTPEEVAANFKNAMSQRPPDPGMLKFELDQAKLRLETIFKEGELQIKERAQTLKEKEAEWAQFMEKSANDLKVILQQRVDS